MGEFGVRAPCREAASGKRTRCLAIEGDLKLVLEAILSKKFPKKNFAKSIDKRDVSWYNIPVLDTVP